MFKLNILHNTLLKKIFVLQNDQNNECNNIGLTIIYRTVNLIDLEAL